MKYLKLSNMRVEDGKIIIDKNDLNRKVILVRNAKSEEELNLTQVSAMTHSPKALVIKEESFKKYNDFRVQNKLKRIRKDQVLILDLRKFEQEENFENINQKSEL